MNTTIHPPALVSPRLALALGLLFASAVEAAPALTLEKNATPPGTAVSAGGTGFSGSETVALYFDRTLLGSVVARNGAFTGTIKIPKSALPTTHRIMALGQSSRLTAQRSLIVRTDWAQFGFGSSHQAYNPYENVLSASNVGALADAWHYYDGGAYSVGNTPAVVDGMVYFATGYPGDTGTIHKLDAKTGAVQWTLTGGKTPSPPTVAGGLVYELDLDGTLYTLNAATGALKWSRQLGNGSCWQAPVAVADGRVYAAECDSRTLYVLNAATGTPLWSREFSQGIGTPPTVAGGMVYVGSDHLYALDAATGAAKWDYDAGADTRVSSTIAAAGGNVFAEFRTTVLNGPAVGLYALDAVTGMWQWHGDMESSPQNGLPRFPPVVVNGLVVTTTNGGKIYAWSAADGSPKWQYQIPLPAWLEASPLYDSWLEGASASAANGVVYATASFQYCEPWDPDNPNNSQCASGGTINALNIADGTALWRKDDLDGSVSTGQALPAVVDGVLYFSQGGSLHAFKPVP